MHYNRADGSPRPRWTTPHAALILLASPAYATEAEVGGDASMVGVVTLLLGIAAAYLLTHYVLDAFQRRLLFTSGLEYVLLGVLLGPLVLSIRLFDDLTPLAPLIALAAGWIGLLVGTRLDLATLLTTRDGSMRLSLTESAVTGLAVALGGWWILTSGWLGELDPRSAWMAAGAMGATAAAGSSTAVDLVTRTYRVESGGLAGVLRRAADQSDLWAIVVLGILFCAAHTGDTATAREVTPTEWGAISVGLGLVLGVAFVLLLGDDEHPNSRFLALVGIIAFASGAAFFLHLSLLLVNLVLGAVLANAARRRGWHLGEILEGTHRPMTLVLLVFAGALWVPPEPLGPALGLVGAYVALRFGGKHLGAWLGTVGTPIRRDVARGLLAQGDVAVAMAISLRLVYEGPAIDLAYTAILASVVVSEFGAPRILKGLLVDAGEISDEAGLAATEATEVGG